MNTNLTTVRAALAAHREASRDMMRAVLSLMPTAPGEHDGQLYEVCPEEGVLVRFVFNVYDDGSSAWQLSNLTGVT